MGIVAIIREALRIARTHKSLWLFGFLVAFGGNVNWSSGGGEQAGASTLPEPGVIAAIVLIALAVVIGMIVLRFLSTAALIEGVRRARRNVGMTVGEGFREGWAHWGVLFRVALLYAAIGIASFLLLAGGCYLVWLTLGSPAVYVACGVAALIGVPWLLTLYMWQAFAERIAVLENRRALDAMHKARLFLHGRLQLGLKLLVAAFLGVLFVGAIGALVLVPLVLLLQALAPVWGLPAFAVGVLTLLPLGFVAFAFIGIMTSSVWTIGYLTQVEQ